MILLHHPYPPKPHQATRNGCSIERSRRSDSVSRGEPNTPHSALQGALVPGPDFGAPGMSRNGDIPGAVAPANPGFWPSLTQGPCARMLRARVYASLTHKRPLLVCSRSALTADKLRAHHVLAPKTAVDERRHHSVHTPTPSPCFSPHPTNEFGASLQRARLKRRHQRTHTLERGGCVIGLVRVVLVGCALPGADD